MADLGSIGPLWPHGQNAWQKANQNLFLAPFAEPGDAEGPSGKGPLGVWGSVPG